jgi:hypothetical protein
MTTLQWHDLRWALLRCPGKVLERMKERPNKVLLAGGFIRACIAHEEINDIDLFAPSAESALELANALAQDQDRAKNDKGLLPGITATDNAYTLRHIKPIAQVIHRWTYEQPEACVASFDFTVAQAAIWHDGSKWQSVVSDSYYADLAAKRLIYTSPKRIEEVGGSMLRVLKFYQRGYRIPLDSLGAVIARLMSGVDMEKIHGDSEEKEGRIGKVLTGLLREVDPNIDPTHICHLPAKDEENQL